jgi:hypothetical protein
LKFKRLGTLGPEFRNAGIAAFDADEPVEAIQNGHALAAKRTLTVVQNNGTIRHGLQPTDIEKVDFGLSD